MMNVIIKFPELNKEIFIKSGELSNNEMKLIQISSCVYQLISGNKVFEVTLDEQDNSASRVGYNGNYLTFEIADETSLKLKEILSQSQSHLHKQIHVKSPMPGLIAKIKVIEGQTVKLGESIATLEAMKMENELKSPQAGTVKKVLVKEGTTVEKNTELFIIES